MFPELSDEDLTPVPFNPGVLAAIPGLSSPSGNTGGEH
jgi:hypothetical protein